VDKEGIETGRKNLAGLVAMEEAAGVAKNRIIVRGFSQGGTLAAHTVLSEKDRLGCCVLLSTFMSELLLPPSTQPQSETPFMQCHGEEDEMVSIDWGRNTRDMLKSHVKDFTYQEFEHMGHEGTEAELQLVKDFILKHVPEIKDEND